MCDELYFLLIAHIAQDTLIFKMTTKDTLIFKMTTIYSETFCNNKILFASHYRSLKTCTSVFQICTSYIPMKVGLMRLFTSCTKQVCDSKKSAPRLKHTRDFLASSPNRATELLLNRHAGYFDPSHLHADQYLIYKPRSGPPALFDVSGVELNFFSGIRHHNAQQQATTPNLAVHSRGICLLAR